MINADAAGNDGANLNDEYIVIGNTGDQSIDLSGWTVEDEAAHSDVFPAGFTLKAGTTVTLRTGSGTATDTELYWGAGLPLWNTAGDTVVLSSVDRDHVLGVSHD